ncbi:energy-coupling factor transporter transmembrane protein EcfT [Brevibacterium daeguense]|uniref:Energy-coupling factor transporter transmembrane protein EcfT n=1 Tax=Brevibacterium daeguense TaxID=909936 RepID=A0ABP8EFX4_9MICO|nr:energy-coupling factor transporter transmembrane protein EcfT [Brevibacterium daeguense]
MKKRQQFLGRYLPGSGWLHRLPTGWKLIGVAVLSLLVLVFRDPRVSTVLIAAVLAMGLSARLPIREILAPVRRIWLIVVIIIAFHVVITDAWTAYRIVSTLLVCVLAAGLLMLTSTVGQLLGVFEKLATPMRILGVRPERVGLTAALMVRSLPFIADLSGIAADSARARGLERSVRARTVPLVLGAVKYATDTGRALDARGLGD